MEEADADIFGAGELIFATPHGAVALVGAVVAVGLAVAHPRHRYAAALGGAAHLMRPARLAPVVPGPADNVLVAVLFVDARLTVLFPVASIIHHN